MKSAQQVNDSFRKQIRNRQKQQIFQNLRKKFQQQHKQMSNNNMQNNNSTNKSIINNLSPITSQSLLSTQFYKNALTQPTLKSLAQQLDQDQSLKLFHRLIDTGTHHQLIKNLQNNINLNSTLQVISIILGKEKIKVSAKFVRLGLIDQLVRIMKMCADENWSGNGQLEGQQFYEIISLSMNILANIVFENVENAEIMLENNVHIVLFGLARKVIEQFSNKNSNINFKSNKYAYDAGFNIMWALAALLQVQSNLDYKQKFLQILQFSIDLLTKYDLYQKLLLQMIFLVGYSFPLQAKLIANNPISTILQQIPMNYPHIDTLLIVIKILTPMDIDYRKVCDLIVICQKGKAVSYGIRILEVLIGRGGEQFKNIIPKNIEWWQRLYLKLIKSQDIQIYLGLLRKTNIRSEWVYPILYQILEKHTLSSITLLNECLILINSLLQNADTPQQRKKVKFYLKSAGIVNKLEKLYQLGNNVELCRKVEFLLIAIGNGVM